MAIGLQRLRYFHATAASGSISAAARAMNIAQPALSYHIAAIERELGTPVLVRSNRGVTLTVAGELLFRRADAVMKTLEETENEIRETVRVPHGLVRLTLAVTMARPLVPIILRTVEQRYPKIDLKITDVSSMPAARIMVSGQADLALAPNPADMANCRSEPVYRERLCLIARHEDDAPGRRDEPIAFAALRGRALVLAARQYDLRRRVEDVAATEGITLNVRYEHESQEIIRAIVMAGLAATISQAALFDPHTERPHLSIRPIVAPEIRRTHHIIRRGDHLATSAIEAVADATRAAIAHLVRAGVFPGQVVTAARAR